MWSRTVAGTGWILLAAAGALIGCEDDQRRAATETSTAAAADGGLNAPSVDPRIAKALESAAAEAPDAGAAGDGPPPNGVFAPGEADKAHPKDAPRKVQLFDDGGAPRVDLAGTVAGLPSRTVITVAQRIGPQAMPTLAYTVAMGKPAAAAGDEASGAPAGAPPIPQRVEKVALAAEQPGAIPPELDKEVAKLKGSVITARLGSDGAWIDPKLEPAKTADEGLRPALQALVGAIDLAWVPSPGKPVGEGAYWMVVDRARPAGIEVVRYRVYRVTAVDGNQVTLNLDVRQYSVGGLVSFPGAPEGLVLTAVGLNSTGSTAVTATAGGSFAQAIDLTMPVQLQVESKERPGQPLLLQAETALQIGRSAPQATAGAGSATTARPTASPTATP